MKSRRVVARGVLAAMCVVLAYREVRAVSESDLVQRSRVAASHGDWNLAAQALEELVRAGIDSPDVLYDLGTADANAGRFGEAIWRFEQVDRRAPFALDTQHNLRAARLRLAHRDAARSGRAVVGMALPFGTWLAELLPLDWSVVLTILGELGVLACIFMFRRGTAGEATRVAAVAAATLLVGAVGCTGSMATARALEAPAGIVLHDGLRLLESPSPDAIPDVPLREGERVTMITRDGSYVRVRTLTGALGWLGARDLGELGL